MLDFDPLSCDALASPVALAPGELGALGNPARRPLAVNSPEFFTIFCTPREPSAETGVFMMSIETREHSTNSARATCLICRR